MLVEVEKPIEGPTPEKKGPAKSIYLSQNSRVAILSAP